MPAGTIVQQPGSPTAMISAKTPLPAKTIQVISPPAGFDLTKAIYVGVPVLSTWNGGLLSTNYYTGAWWCSGTATLSGGTVTVPLVGGGAVPPSPCLAGATVIGVVENNSGVPNALGWSLSGNGLTIKSSDSSDSSVVSWWRLK
jgi:hypothetical protein